MKGRDGIVRILSIDGGGIRGYIPALVLSELERRRRSLGKDTPLASRFDIIAGTSTGSLIALALSAPADRAPKVRTLSALARAFAAVKGLMHAGLETASRRYSVDDLVRFYEEESRYIFPATRMHLVKQAVGAKYDHKPFERILLGKFGNLRMSDAANVVLVPAYDAGNAEALIMKNTGDGEDFLMRDAARGSAAAPTYFQAARIGSLGSKSRIYTLLDGGLIANNPALCAYIEALRLFPQARKFLLVSLGTGSVDYGIDAAKLPKWGLLDWIDPGKGTPLFGMMSDGQASVTDYHLRHLPDVDYVRLEPVSNVNDIPIDGVSPRSFSLMLDAANAIIAANEGALSDIARRL